jgi:hypothetical protein
MKPPFAISRCRFPSVLLVAALPVLATCGPVSREAAEAECFERARLATQPRGEVYVGSTVGPGGRPYAGGKVTITSDFLQGRDPSALYDACVFNRSGQPPSQPLYTRSDWKG